MKNPNKPNKTQTQNNIFSNQNSQINYKELAIQLKKAPTYKEASKLMTKFMLQYKLEIEDIDMILEELKKIDYLRYLEFLGDTAVEEDEYSYNPDLDDY